MNNKKRSRTINVKKGEWYLLLKNKAIHQCCFCSLTHRIETMIVRGKKSSQDRIAIRWLPYD